MNTDNVIRKNHPNEVLKSAIFSGATTKIVTLSIIFDETVEIFNVSSDKNLTLAPAEVLALNNRNSDISMARRNSLLRFLEKRKERLCGDLKIDMKIVLLTIRCNGRAVNFNVSSSKEKDIVKFAKNLKIKNVLPLKKELYVETSSGG
uniref:Uncharacterized protein n=1 Tax=Solanum lycopersicum TaxID=4081 RepID=A0A3Q7EAE9_SOLLC